MKKKNRLTDCRSRLVYGVKYMGGEGFEVVIVPKAPRSARTKADVIAVITLKRTKRGSHAGKLRGVMNYYTPDEAMSIGLGLIKAVDTVMEEHFRHFRKHKDTSL
jgi:hypothetical protein